MVGKWWKWLERHPWVLWRIAGVLFAISIGAAAWMSRDDGSFNPQQEPILLLRLPRGYRPLERVPFPEFVAFEVRRHRRNQMRTAEDSIVPLVGKKLRKDKDKRASNLPLSTSWRIWTTGREAADVETSVDFRGKRRDLKFKPLSRALLSSSSMSRIYVVEKYRFCFCTVPGVASRAFKSFLRRLHGASDYLDPEKLDNDLITLSNYSIRDRERFLTDPGITRVIFMRHPLERMASLYLHGNDTTDERAHQEFVARVRGRKLDEDAGSRTIIHSGLKTLSHLVTNLRKFGADSSRLDRTFWPAYSLCSMDQVKYDFVGQLNRLDEDVSALQQKLKLPVFPLPSREQLGIRPQQTMERMGELYNDPNLRKRTYQLLQKDFGAFDYEQ